MSLTIKEHIPLAQYTTMKVGGEARFFVEVQNSEELFWALQFAREKGLPFFVLGGGSNTLVSGAGFPGLVIKIEMRGIHYEGTRVTVSAGEKWDDVVRDIVAHDLWGVENLSLIPGTTGGATVQNIGAYGVEARDTIFSVAAFDIETNEIKTFFNNECAFGYRESLFKKNKNLIVVRTTFSLTKERTPHTEYEDVKKYFAIQSVVNPSLNNIRDAIIAIRITKMPALGIGTAGSFFKNPIVSMDEYERFKKEFPDIKAYPQRDMTVKLSAGWLLDHVGQWRGVRRGDAGVHEKQALILVNYGSATGEEMLLLAHDMKKSIKEKTNVLLEEEVVMI